MRNLHAWWRKRLCSDRSHQKTSLLSLLTSTRRTIVCTIFYRILAKKNIVEFSSKKLMRWRELCIVAQNHSRISVAVCYFLRQELTEDNLRKWWVRYDWCQRRVADKTCRFLIACTVAVLLVSLEWDQNPLYMYNPVSNVTDLHWVKSGDWSDWLSHRARGSGALDIQIWSDTRTSPNTSEPKQCELSRVCSLVNYKIVLLEPLSVGPTSEANFWCCESQKCVLWNLQFSPLRHHNVIALDKVHTKHMDPREVVGSL
jgi:hypothetical protein